MRQVLAVYHDDTQPEKPLECEQAKNQMIESQHHFIQKQSLLNVQYNRKTFRDVANLNHVCCLFRAICRWPPLFSDDGLDSRVAEHWVSRKLDHARRKIDCH